MKPDKTTEEEMRADVDMAASVYAKKATALIAIPCRAVSSSS